MATTLQKDDILKAVQAMTKEECLRLIAEIAALPDEESLSRTAETAGTKEDFDDEVMRIAREIMDVYSNLLRNLAH